MKHLRPSRNLLRLGKQRQTHTLAWFYFQFRLIQHAANTHWPHLAPHSSLVPNQILYSMDLQLDLQFTVYS